MKASVEISMYPLDPAYGNVILEFLHRLRQYSELTIQTNTMSTQVFGEYDEMMAILTKEMKPTFAAEDAVVVVMKLANLDLTP